jgi:hypothetical protein
MKYIDILLYTYFTMCINYLMHYVLAGLDAMAPSQVCRPALQRVRTAEGG